MKAIVKETGKIIDVHYDHLVWSIAGKGWVDNVTGDSYHSDDLIFFPW